jgi:hypothetical protein
MIGTPVFSDRTEFSVTTTVMRLSSPTFSVLLVAAACLFGGAQSRSQDQPIKYGPIPGDLANALAEMARASRVPIVAELSQPLPHITMTNGAKVSDDSLNQLLKQAPGYEWKREGKTIHFYNKQVRVARFNFLNWPIPRFTVPINLSELKLWFPGRVVGLLEGFTAEGGVVIGPGDTELAKEKLQQVTLENKTGLEILLRIANENPTFYTIVVFPKSTPTKKQAELNVSWFWGSLHEKSAPLYVQPVGTIGRPAKPAG